MAKSSLDAEMAKQLEELALRWLNYLKFRLAQDGAQFRDQIVQYFGQWIVSRPRRITRYEAADFKMLDEFLDLAWPAIMDPNVPMPVEPAEPQKLAGPARVAPRPRNNWVARAFLDENDPRAVGAANDLRVDWHAVQDQARQIFANAPQGRQAVINQAQVAGQQWLHVDDNGNWVPVNR